jgi:two-component SAPR family response regulator
VTDHGSLTGLKVLLVEDEMLVSLLIEDTLLDERCIVVGPFSRVPGAMEAARNAQIDLAILDVNIAGTMVFPVAEILATRHIPFLFLSGYGQRAVPHDHPDWSVCSKPFRPEELVTMLVAQMDASLSAP